LLGVCSASVDSAMAGSDGLKVGDIAKITGLSSLSGQELNGQEGTVTRFVELKSRFEIMLSSTRLVSLKPENLWRVGGAVDGRWSRGDLARVVGVPTQQEAQAVSGSLGELVSRGSNHEWVVRVQGKTFNVSMWNLRVCTREDDDPRGLLALRPRSQLLLGFALLGTLVTLLGAELALRRLVIIRLGVVAVVPGLGVLLLAGLAPACSLAWILGTVRGCYVLHMCLKDPTVTFPQISELGIGPRCSKALYRIGFAASAALHAAMVLVHKDLALPHLPYGDGDLGWDFTWFGLLAAAGVALQGVFLLEAKLSSQTVVHLLGALLFFYGAWSHMGAAQRLYFPELPVEDSPDFDDIAGALQLAAESALLRHPFVSFLVYFRHYILMRAPLALFVLPLLSQFSERVGSQLGSSARSMMGLAQWLVVLNFALIFVSYGPELMVAATLPLPLQEA